jgi:hypothetical protein
MTMPQTISLAALTVALVGLVAAPVLAKDRDADVAAELKALRASLEADHAEMTRMRSQIVALQARDLAITVAAKPVPASPSLDAFQQIVVQAAQEANSPQSPHYFTRQQAPEIGGAPMRSDRATPFDTTAVTYSRSKGIQLGALSVKPGGYIEGSAVWRAKNQTSDLTGMSYTALPYPNSPNAHQGEVRFSGRSTRLNILIAAKPDDVSKISAFVESDFLGSGTSSNNLATNSYAMRLRYAWIGYERSDLGLHLFAGQTASLENSYAIGQLPLNESGLLVIDQSNIPGFSGVRLPTLRLVKDLPHRLSFGIALEGPATTYAGTIPSNVIVTNPGTGTYNSTSNTYSTEHFPDVVAKLAADTRFGHFEVTGIARFLHAQAAVGSVSEGQNVTAGGIHLGARIPIVRDALELRIEGLKGTGVSHYDFAGFPDATVSQDGRLQAIPFGSASVGLAWKPDRRDDLYAYAGYAKVGHTRDGYGVYTVPQSSTAGCMVVNSPVCAATTQSDWAITAGGWHRLFQGPAGVVSIGLNGFLYGMNAFRNGEVRPHATNQRAEFSFRYAPF